MYLIAHRGLTTNDIKENTIESFKNALKNKYDGIELDIRYTKDKKIVIHHDYLINRTSNGKGSLKKYSYNELKKFNFGSKKIPQKIPLLIDVIKIIKNTIIFIELKEKINVKDLINIIKRNKTNQYYICSFNFNFIKDFINTDYKVGLINNIFNSKDIYNKLDFVMILENIFNMDIYNKMMQNNIEVVLYGTLNNISLKNKEILAKIKYII